MSVQGCAAEAYIQFKTFDGEVATLYNVVKSKTSIGHYLMANSGVSVEASTNGKKTLVTILCVVGGPA